MQATRGAAGSFSLRARSGNSPSPTKPTATTSTWWPSDRPCSTSLSWRPTNNWPRSGLEKGSMTLVDLPKANAVQEFMGAPRFVSGGSVANTTAGIAVLGGTAGFVGAVADDEVGRTYTENLRAAGVEFEPHLSESAAARRARHRALRRAHHRGRRPHHGDLSGRRVDVDARGGPDVLRGAAPPSSCSRAICGTCRRPRRRCATRRPPLTAARARWRSRCRTRSASGATSESSSTS